jgi:predicted  nucleic acid-binding Zn-ribbon protein
MSEDFTNKEAQSDNHVLRLILMTMQSLDTRVIAFDTRFTSLETRFDRFETRIVSRLEKVEWDIDQLQKSQEGMRGEIRDLNSAVVDLSRDQTVLTDTVRKMGQNFQDVFERLHIVEVTGHQPNSTT